MLTCVSLLNTLEEGTFLSCVELKLCDPAIIELLLTNMERKFQAPTRSSSQNSEKFSLGPAARHSCRSACSLNCDNTASEGRSPRSLPASRNKFIARYHRQLIRGIPTGPRIFAYATYESRVVRGRHYKKTLYYIPTVHC